MKTSQMKDFHFSSDLGTDFILRPFYDGRNAYAGHDYLLAQIYGGSYKSTVTDPLYAVQVAMCPFTSSLSVIPPAATDYAMSLGVIVNQGNLNALKTKSPTPVPGVTHPEYIDIHQSSPSQDNNSTTHSTSWGLTVGADLGDTPGSASASYNQSKSWTIHDMEVYRHEFDPNRDGSTGVCWNLIFTKKDGMNQSSFAPRMDALFQCSKDMLHSGKMTFLLVERLVYWGEWSENIDVTLGEATGIAAAAGTPAGGPIGAAFGAVVGAISGALANRPAISTAEKNARNHRLDLANRGDSHSLHMISDVAYSEHKSQLRTTIFSLDFDRNEVTTISGISL